MIMINKKYNYVYLTTNIITGKQYVGDHSTDNLDRKNNKNYFGSGKLIKIAQEKYGKSNFKKEILEFFPSKDEAFKNQEKYIKLYNTLAHNGYNISPTGGACITGWCSEETKKKISNTNKGKSRGPASNKTKEKMKISATGVNNSMYGKPAWDAVNKLLKECKYCGIKTNVGNYGRWHGEKCKSRIII